MTPHRALFVTWDGPGQTYLESLYFPIFREMRAFGWQVDTLQMVYGPLDDVARTAAAAARSELGYEALHSPGGIVRPFNLARGAYVLGLRQDAYDLIIARSIVPASVVLAVPAARRRFVFDADGLVADERIDFAKWRPNAAPYQVFRFVEQAAILAARATLVRTERAKTVMLARAGAGLPEARVRVVANGKDATEFVVATEADRNAARMESGVSTDALWLIYCGSIGPQYRIHELLQLFDRVRVRRPDARLTILTGAPDKAAALVGFRSSVDVLRLPPSAIARVLGAADIGIGLRTPSFSQQAVSPIKVAEYLLCGLPTVTTQVGDLGDELAHNPAVLLLDGLNSVDLDRAATWIVEHVAQNRELCRRSARTTGIALYSHVVCAQKYAGVLDQATHGFIPAV